MFYTRVWDTRNMQPAFTFPAQQYFQVFNLLEEYVGITSGICV